MPHTYIKEGMYIHTCIKTTLPWLQVDFNFEWVRFMPHVYIKEGMYTNTYITTTLPWLLDKFSNSEWFKFITDVYFQSCIKKSPGKVNTLQTLRHTILADFQ